MKKVSGRLANLTPEQREKLLKKLREQKQQVDGSQNSDSDNGEFLGLSAGERQLSFAQQRLWFLDQLDNRSAVYNIPAKLEISGDLNVDALEASLKFLFNRHDSLRCIFPEVDGLPQIKLLDEHEFKFEIEDLSDYSKKERDEFVEKISTEIACKHFNLERDVLFRVHLAILSRQEFVLVICMHHIISDAWSMRILIQELSQAYNQLSKGQRVNLDGKPSSYLDYAVWQRRQLESPKIEQQIEFWKVHLDKIKVLNFPSDYIRPLEQTHDGKQVVIELTPALTQKIKTLSRQHNTTTFSVLLTAWYLILEAYSHQQDICIGTPVANRPYSSLETSIGYYVNTLPIRIQGGLTQNFLGLLEQVTQSALKTFSNPDLPFEKMINELGLERDPSQSPIFQSMFSFQNEALEQQFGFDNLEVKLTPIHTNTAKFDLALDVMDKGRNIELALEFNSDLISLNSGCAILENFQTALESIVNDPEILVKKINILSQAEFKKISTEWNGIRKTFTKHIDLANQFEICVKKHPERIAIKNEKNAITFNELNITANRVARNLADVFVQTHVKPIKIGLCFDNITDHVIALLSMLKLGICYIPVNLNEIDAELATSNQQIYLLRDRKYENKFSSHNLDQFIYLDWDILLKAENNTDNLNLDIDSEKLAIQSIILDESSSEVNKPWCASHRAITNYVDWYRTCVQEFNVSGQEIHWCMISSFNEYSQQKYIFASLLLGATLHHYNEESLKQWAFQELKQLDHVVLSSTLDTLTNIGESYSSALPKVSMAFLENEDISLLRNTQNISKLNIEIWNCFCVEGSGDIVSALRFNTRSFAQEIFYAYGRPIQNNQVYLLDDDLKPVPTGAWGRVFICGFNIDCYKAFQSNSFVEIEIAGEAKSLFPLNELARYSGDGGLYRYQANIITPKTNKIPDCLREYRHTLALINSSPGVAQTMLFQEVGKQTSLIAIIAKQKGSVIESNIIEEYLKSHLVYDLVPDKFIIINRFPKDGFGKIIYQEITQFLKNYSRQEMFWSDYLADKHELVFPYDSSRELTSPRHIEVQTFSIELDDDFSFAEIDLEHAIRAAWVILLAKYCGQTEFTYHHQFIINNFNWAQEQRMGFFPVKVCLLDKDTVEHVYQQQIDTCKLIAQNTNVEQADSDILLSFGSNIVLTESGELHLAVDKIEHAKQKAVKAKLSYNTERFSSAAANQFIRLFLDIIENFDHVFHKNWNELELLSREQLEEILNVVRGEQRTYQPFDNISQFLTCGIKNENSIALVSYQNEKAVEISYKSLHRQATQLALYIAQQGLEQQAPIALCFERSVDTVIAILASIKLGSPYLPLDPELPPDRLKFMVEDSKAQFVLCHNMTGDIGKFFSNTINLDDELVKSEIVQCKADGEIKNTSGLTDLFNIIYTSGSTGQPKGVMVTQEGILNRIQWMQEQYLLLSESRVLQKTTYSFDVSVWEFIWPLSQGACLVLAKPNGQKDPLYLRQLMAEQKITHCHFVPSMLSSWLDLIDDQANENLILSVCLKQVFCSGEALSRKAVNQFYSLFPNTELHNLYGPTEASIDVSYWHCEKNLNALIPVPIGKPVSNTSLYVLDTNLKVLPYGIAGELFIAGKQLAKGYLNRKELTDKTFIETSLDGENIERLYRTGDLVRLSHFGHIEYLGRIDHQVKIRGYRIELGEIENHIQAVKGVGLCAVIAKEVGNSKQLLAYLNLIDEFYQQSLADQHQTFKQKLKQQLAERLPEYMLPTSFIILEHIPLLNNGKINRKALPEPDFQFHEQDFKAAESEIEKILQVIWQQVLGIEQVGILDNFFELGGDSILSLQIISAARKQGLVINPVQIFRYPTILALSKVVSFSDKSPKINQSRVAGSHALTPIQNWFFSEISVEENSANSHFNQSLMLDLKFDLRIEDLQNIVLILLEKHDVLRSYFLFENQNWRQIYSESQIPVSKLVRSTSFERDNVNVDSIRLREIIDQTQQALDICSGILIHFNLINEVNKGIKTQRLYIVAHHLVIDGVSWRILLEDLNELFQPLVSGENHHVDNFLTKTLSFKDWSNVLQKLSDSHYFDSEKEYWKALLKRLRYYRSPLETLTKYNKSEYRSCYANQKRISFALSRDTSERFLKQAQKNFRADANDILLCALTQTFKGNEFLALNLEMHGRDLPETWWKFLNYPDISRTMGWFTSLFPVILQLDETRQTWPEKIKSIKEQIRQIPAKGIGFGLLSQVGSKSFFKGASLQAAHLDISFNYLGQIDQVINSNFFGESKSIDEVINAGPIDQDRMLKRPHLLDVLVYFKSGKLNCDFLYDQQVFKEKQIKHLLASYQENLEQLIQSICVQNYPALTPSDLKACTLSQVQIDTLEHSYYGSSVNTSLSPIETIHDLLPTQEGMLFHNLYSSDLKNENQYVEQFCVELIGKINHTHFQTAWQLLVQKHENLRSAFFWQDQHPVQIVFANNDFKVEFIDYTNKDGSWSLDNFLEQDRKKGFDLSKMPLMRVYMVSHEDDRSWLIWSYHHILLDGWSVPLVLNDVFEFYTKLCDGLEHKRLQQKSIFRFEDYISWYKSHNAEQIPLQKQFWSRQLEGFTEANPIDLEALSHPIAKEDVSDGVISLSLGKQLSESLRSFGRQHQYTLNTIIQTSWAILLAHYCDENDIVFGTTVSGRPNEYDGVENIVGMFINTLPLRVKFDARTNLLQLMQQIQNTQQEIAMHQTSSLMHIQKWARIEDENKLFNSILVFENFPVNEKLKQENAWFGIGKTHSFEKTNYPITLIIEPGEIIKFRVLYDALKYRRPTILRMLGHLETIISNLDNHINSSVFDIPYIKPDEILALTNWNKTQTVYPRESNLTQLVAEKVAQYPRNIALKFDNETLTYEQLDHQSNQLARFLHQQGIKKGQRVALFLDRSRAMLISALAVIKTGAAYVPLDPGYPKERLQYMLQDCEPGMILSLTLHKQVLQQVKQETQKCTVYFCDELFSQLQAYDGQQVDFYKDVKAEDLAYLMYTSGSTGLPKGVCLSHRSMTRLLINNWYLNLGPNDRVGYVANVCFDASAYEMWGALLHGATLIGFTKETILNGELFEQKLQREGVTNMLLTTSLFHIYSKQRPSMFKKMRSLLIGGEPLNPDATRHVLENSPPLQILNVYGPTENGVLTTVFDTWNLHPDAKSVPVGKAISNTTVYILDKRNQQVPVGVIGELVSGGDGVGIGYWRKPELSSQSYIDDPILKQDGARAYRTGDLARRLPDGSFEVLGRKDKQIKLRGFRIEPNEIVKKILEDTRLEDAVVIAHESESGQKHLVAYYVVKTGNKVEARFLLEELKTKLPQFMVPQFLVQIPEIPITPNGKLDIEKLPEPKISQRHSDKLIAPRNELEQKLVDVWKDVLKLDSLGINDNFFEIGGDSIISIQIVSRAKRLGIELNPRLLFENPTIEELAKHVDFQEQEPRGEQGLVDGEFALSPIQSWFFNQDFENKNHFNQSVLFKVNGFLTIQSVTPVLSAILRQHDVLRLRFEKLDNVWKQKHDNSARSMSFLADMLTEHNLSNSTNAFEDMLEHAREVQGKLSIDKGPLIKLVLYHLGQQGQRLLVVVHHLVIDGVSWRILHDDFNIAFSQQLANQPINLGNKSSSYKQYVQTINKLSQGKVFESTLEYWSKFQEKIRDKTFLTRKSSQEFTSCVLQERFSLSEELSHVLLVDSHHAYKTDAQDLFLLIFALALQNSELSEELLIELEGHGRDVVSNNNESELDLISSLGWFTCIYPVFLELDKHDIQTGNFDTAIKAIKSNLRNVPLKGFSYFLTKYSDANRGVELLKDLPRVELAFNYLGQVHNSASDNVLNPDDSYFNQDLATIQDSSPQNHPSHLFSVSVLYRNKQFHISVNYDSAHISAQLVELFIENFQKFSKAVSQFCTDGNHFGFTPQDLPYCQIDQQTIDQLCIEHAEKQSGSLDAIYPLSPMQEGMLFHSRMDSQSGMYCEQVSVLFSGHLNLSAMEAAWNGAIANHDILRSSFVWENLVKPLQLVQSKATLNIQVLDWRLEKQIDKKLGQFLLNDRIQGFDFFHAPLMRLHYILLPSEHSGQILGRFIWSYHHILLDGWSMPLLMREIFERYNHYLDSKSWQVSEGQVYNYQSYIHWLYQQNADKQSAFRQEQDRFWLNYLAGIDEPTYLGLARVSSEISKPQNTLRFQEQSCPLSEQQTVQLNEFASKHRVTLNTLMQAAWGLLLARYSGEQNILFGITVSGRPYELKGVESIIGLFINTIPFRLRVDENVALVDWLQDILSNQNSLRKYESSPLVEIQTQSQIDSSRALFDSILVFENYPMDASFDYSPSGLNIEELQVFEQTNFPLSVIVLPGKQLDIRILFDVELFEASAITTLLSHLKTLLLDIGNLQADAQRPLQQIDYLSEQEQLTIIKQWNNTVRTYPDNQYLHEIFTQQAQQRDEHLAISYEQYELTYLQLEQKANQLANYIGLEKHGDYSVKPGDKVVICMNRSQNFIVSILAVLKAGAVYVPVDPGYPEERQRYMLEDTRCHLILTDNENEDLVNQLCTGRSLKASVSFINLEQQKQDIDKQATSLHITLPAYTNNQDVPAAILYTSGSTGQPKGVCLTHRGLSRMVLNTNYMDLKSEDRVAHVSNICFDAASFEIWAALLNGLPLIIFKKDIVLDLDLFEKRLKQERVTILLIATALFNLVAKERVTAFRNIRYLFFGGEASNAGMVRKVLAEAPPEHLMHMYGPSENATYATWYEVKHVAETAKSIPIGSPVSNTQVYIMNQQGNLLPPGVAGEIVCAGDGLALGYLNKPEQTQKAFVMRALPGQDPQRMYLTGDLGVWLPDGNIEILGRIDNQVKIRGHRIEPEEVIARINALQNIKKSYVLVKQDHENKKYLVAYFVPESYWVIEQTDVQQRSRELKLQLKNLMPDYMVPSFYVEIDELPLTPNGKIDTKALPEADLMQAASVYQAPETELEKNLVAIWEEVLGQSRIGVNDDFFELGGHSLLATQIHSRIRQQLNIDIPLRTLFELPTIREFCEFWLAFSSNTSEQFDSDNSEEYEEGEL